jgi:type II secretory ATPase GspE/PulE/Tfp pilus assembly ATPase PilB-like protein
MNALPQEILPATLAGRLTDEQKQAVLEAARGQRVAALAAALGLTEPDALTLLAEATGLDIASDIHPDRAALGLMPARLVHDYQVVPILEPGAGPPAEADDDLKPATQDSKQELHLATVWPPDAVMLDWVRTFTPRPLRWHLALPDRVHQLIIEHYGVGSGSLEDSGEDFAPVQNPQGADETVDEDAAVVRFVSDVISQAIADAATDIHFEPQEGQLRIRYRVDGLLVPVPLPENLLRFQDAIISRLKIMARLNISERRLPQDGRINFKTIGSALDIRVSTIPTIYAESVSLRLLNWA